MWKRILESGKTEATKDSTILATKFISVMDMHLIKSEH